MEIKVIICPNCHDHWQHEGWQAFEGWTYCLKPNCKKPYVPALNYKKMPRFVFEAMKRCQG